MVLDTQIVLKNCITLRATFKETQQQQLKIYFTLVWKPFYHKRKRLIMLKKKKQIKLACEIAFMLRDSRCGGVCGSECVC